MNWASCGDDHRASNPRMEIPMTDIMDIDPVEYATLEWLDWFNIRRRLGPIGNVPSAEFERAQ